MSQRGNLVRRVLVALLAIASAIAIAVAFTGPATAPTRRPTASLGTPLWSARRVPQPVIDAVGTQHLTTVLQQQAGANAACVIVSDEAGTLTELNRDRALAPASIAKLLTATAALATLGADFRFTTRVEAPAPPTNGAVDRLDLIGGGDPLIATPERIAFDERDPEQAGLASTPLADLADRIVAAGVRSVPGGIVGIDSRYDRARTVDAWTASERAAIGPIGALTVNDGFAGAAGTGERVDDPARNAAAELTRLLAARGVVLGTPTSGGAAASDRTTIATIESPPLRAILTELLSASDNLSAEMLLRELGARADTPTTAAGVQTVLSTMNRLGVSTAGAQLVDGSGLSHTDTVTCRTVMEVLNLTKRSRFAPIRDGLAIAGRRGTLAPRFRDTPLAGSLRAKTGTLTGVSGLAGFVTGDRTLSFTLLLNGTFGEATAFALRETMASTIAAFPQTRSGTELVPAPNTPIPPRACSRAERAC